MKKFCILVTLFCLLSNAAIYGGNHRCRRIKPLPRPIYEALFSWHSEITSISIHYDRCLSTVESGEVNGVIWGETREERRYYPVVTLASGERFIAFECTAPDAAGALFKLPPFLFEGALVHVLPQARGETIHILKDPFGPDISFAFLT